MRARYEYESLSALQSSWLSWVRAGSPPSGEHVANYQGSYWNGRGWSRGSCSTQPPQAPRAPVATRGATGARGPQGPVGPRGLKGGTGQSGRDCDEARIALLEAEIRSLTVLVNELQGRPDSFTVVYPDADGGTTPDTNQTVTLGGEMRVPPLHYEVVRPGRQSDLVTIPNDGENMFSIDLTQSQGEK